MTLGWIIAFLLAFVFMEWAAWALHKYVMHGVLWSLHEDHHVIDKDKKYQKNDYFAIFFAVPSFLSILYGNLGGVPWLEGAGYGVMLYGVVYFIVHEVAIHRRWKFFNLNGKYIESLRIAHQHHHQVRTKEGASNFGMLLPPLHYFTMNAKELRKLRPLKK
jgi:beta-carotene 3-hydroxylase